MAKAKKTPKKRVKTGPKKASKKPVKKVAKKPAKKATKKQAKKATRKPAKKATRKPAKKATKKPAKKATKKPAKKATKKPAKKKLKSVRVQPIKPKATFKLLRRVADVKKYVEEAKKKRKRIALVPTMGALHEGHLSLIREAHRLAHVVLVSVFVNPTQFGPDEDLDRYPRDLAGDRRKIRASGADAIFAPDAGEMYPDGFQTAVDVMDVTRDYCGASRPSHFRGAATVVAKLFNIVRPDIALFGQKDYQQLVTIRRMVRDLNQDVDIIGMPTVREEDGLAMSSRNTHLSPAQRLQATSMFRGLRKAKRLFESGERDAAELAAVVLDLLREERDLEIDYVAVVDPDRMERIPEVERDGIVLAAVRVGDVRLIDNIRLGPTKSRRR
ncbi:MAG: pantoate--beta-alanine ligase [Deltaproteobacteria bacterium]|nr:pantoate--beta-alanine ligase [Deltaproteobacteria bacterium]